MSGSRKGAKGEETGWKEPMLTLLRHGIAGPRISRFAFVQIDEIYFASGNLQPKLKLECTRRQPRQGNPYYVRIELKTATAANLVDVEGDRHVASLD
jgi:hypothetical protein